MAVLIKKKFKTRNAENILISKNYPIKLLQLKNEKL